MKSPWIKESLRGGEWLMRVALNDLAFEKAAEGHLAVKTQAPEEAPPNWSSLAPPCRFQVPPWVPDAMSLPLPCCLVTGATCSSLPVVMTTRDGEAV